MTGKENNYIIIMKYLSFEWDDVKAEENKRKHGITFEEACSVFLDERAILKVDPDHSWDEEGFLLLGQSIRLNILVVVHTCRESENVLRIISARRATKSEKNDYVKLNRRE